MYRALCPSAVNQSKPVLPYIAPVRPSYHVNGKTNKTRQPKAVHCKRRLRGSEYSTAVQFSWQIVTKHARLLVQSQAPQQVSE